MEALLILSQIPFLGPKRCKELILHAGSAEKALLLTESEVGELPGFGPKLKSAWASAMSDLKSAEEFAKNEIARAQKTGVTLLAYTDEAYPEQLKDLDSPPLLLYAAGQMQCLYDHKTVAIIGTRGASPYGLETAEKIASELSAAGITVISGLARGIDQAAHRGALRRGKTAAVIGSGLAQIYPKEHIDLARSIAENGVVLTEYSFDAPPAKQNFPKRNGVVAALSSALLVIEAPETSGALITAEIALKLNKKIFVLPGRADSENFRGSHALIKTGRGHLIENSGDILSHFPETLAFDKKNSEIKSHLKLSLDETTLLDLLPHQELQFEEIVNLVKWPVAKLMGLLMSLRLKRAVKEFPGKIYKKIPCE